MTGMPGREHVSLLVIVAGAAIGAWILLAKPVADQIAELERTILHRGEQAAPHSDEQSMTGLIEKVQAQRPRLIAIDRFNQLSQDSSRMYGEVRRLADRHGVTVTQLEPGRSRRPMASGAGEVSVINMTVSGGFASLVDFVDAMESLDGYFRTMTVNLSPRSSAGVDPRANDVVDAHIVCEALEFKIPPVLLSLQPSDEGVVHGEH